MTKFGKLIFTLIIVAVLSVVIFFLQKKSSPDTTFYDSPIGTVEIE